MKEQDISFSNTHGSALTETRAHGIRLLLVAAGLVGLLAACGDSGTSVAEAMDKIVPAVCEKAKECYSAEAFKNAFPDGHDQCVQKVKNEMGLDPNARSACDSATLDKCAADIRSATCPEKNEMPKAPCDC